MENNNRFFNKKNIIIIILSIFLCLSLIFIVFQNINNHNSKYITEDKQASIITNELANTQKNLVQQNNKVLSLQNEIQKYKKQIDFMNEYVAICPLDGSGLYHKYDCKALDTSSFMIYNIEQAPNEGYSPCTNCYNNTITTSNIDTEIVFVTNNGTKYHREWCSYLKSKKSIEKAKAIEKGYTACSRCNP